MQIDPRLVPEIPRWSPSPEFTPEQADVLRRLEAYPHPAFNLRRTGASTLLDRMYGTCFVCVAAALGDFEGDCNALYDLAGPKGGNSWWTMLNLVGVDYGRSVPIVRDHPPTAVPKHVAIEAVREIFRMGNAERNAQ